MSRRGRSSAANSLAGSQHDQDEHHNNSDTPSVAATHTGTTAHHHPDHVRPEHMRKWTHSFTNSGKKEARIHRRDPSQLSEEEEEEDEEEGAELISVADSSAPSATPRTTRASATSASTTSPASSPSKKKRGRPSKKSKLDAAAAASTSAAESDSARLISSTPGADSVVSDSVHDFGESAMHDDEEHDHIDASPTNASRLSSPSPSTTTTSSHRRPSTAHHREWTHTFANTNKKEIRIHRIDKLDPNAVHEEDDEDHENPIEGDTDQEEKQHSTPSSSPPPHAAASVTSNEATTPAKATKASKAKSAKSAKAAAATHQEDAAKDDSHLRDSGMVDDGVPSASPPVKSISAQLEFDIIAAEQRVADALKKQKEAEATMVALTAKQAEEAKQAKIEAEKQAILKKQQDEEALVAKKKVDEIAAATLAKKQADAAAAIALKAQKEEEERTAAAVEVKRKKEAEMAAERIRIEAERVKVEADLKAKREEADRIERETEADKSRRREEELKLQREAEEKARKEAELAAAAATAALAAKIEADRSTAAFAAKLKREAEEEATRQQQHREHEAAEAKVRAEAEAQRIREEQVEAAARAKAEADRLAAELEVKRRAEEAAAEVARKATAEEVERKRREAEAAAAAEKARLEEEARIQREAEEKRHRLDEEERLQRETAAAAAAAAEKVRLEEVARLQREEELRLKREAEEKARLEEIARLKREEELRLQREAEEKARCEAEERERARLEAERLQREAEEKARREAEERERARIEAERLQREVEERARLDEEERQRLAIIEQARLEAEAATAAKAEQERIEAEEKAALEEAERMFIETLLEAENDPTSIQSQLSVYRTATPWHPSSSFSYDAFTQLISTIRSLITAGMMQIDELERTDTVVASAEDDDEEMNSDAPQYRRVQTPLRPMLHQIRIAFARNFPLPASSWSEWIEDAQTIGSGVTSTNDVSSMNEEERERAVGSDEQHFLISLYRIALCDYASPQLADSFLTYMVSASDTLLSSSPSALHSYRIFARQLITTHAWSVERRRRLGERAKKKREVAEKKKQAQHAEAKQDKDKDEDESDDEEGDDGELSEEEEKHDNEEDARTNPFAALHPALHCLLSLPYSRTINITGELPSLIPLGYSHTKGDELFQKLRSVEMKILTGMMRKLQQKQQADGEDESMNDDDDDATNQTTIEAQMNRITKLYRLQLTIPMHGLSGVYASFQDWLAKQGVEGEDGELKAVYESATETSQQLQTQFEQTLNEFEQLNTLQSSIGILSQQASDLFRQYVDSFQATSKTRKQTVDNPSLLFATYERIVSLSFLDPAWWHRYLSALQQFLPTSHGTECMKLHMDVAYRAHRNCPYDAEIVRVLFHTYEELQESATELVSGRVIVEEMMRNILENPALKSNVDANIEAFLLVIDYHRRTLLVPAAAAIATNRSLTRTDALLIRSYFQSIRALLPYAQNPSLASRVYEYWVDIEGRYLHAHHGASGDSDEAQKDEAHSAQYEAQKEHVSVTVWRGRQLWNDATSQFGVTNAHIWLDYIAYEMRTISSPGHVAFVRGIFRRAIDTMTDVNMFVPSVQSLTALEPLLTRWLQFERIHCSTLAEMHSAERRAHKYIHALQEAKRVEWQQQMQVPPPAAAPSSSHEAQAAKKPKAKSKKNESKKGDAAAASSSSGGDASENKKKRKRQSDDAVAPAEEQGVSDKQQEKKQKTKEKEKEKDTRATPESMVDSTTAMDTSSTSTTAASASGASTPAPAAPVPPHTLFISHLQWTMREADHRALLSPYGTIARLVNHRGSKLIKKPYVEVTYATEAEATACETALQGKVLSGQKLAVARLSPRDIEARENEPDPLSVFIKNLPKNRPDIEELVRKFFEPCGDVTAVEIAKYTVTPAATPTAASSSTAATITPIVGFKTSGTVHFSSTKSVTRALALNMHAIGDQLILVVPNTSHTRERRQREEAEKVKLIEAAKKRPVAAFAPRSTMIVRPRPTPATTRSQAVASNSSTAAAPILANSNEEFRAKLLGSK